MAVVKEKTRRRTAIVRGLLLYLEDFIPMQIKHAHQMRQDQKGVQRKLFYVMSFTNNKNFYLHKIYS